ncbi:hypothetical protein Tco_0532157 [Tanacetum coccineum]
MSAMRRSDNENILSLMNLIHMCWKDLILHLEILSRRFFLNSQVDPHGFEDGDGVYLTSDEDPTDDDGDNDMGDPTGGSVSLGGVGGIICLMS